jgi:hypothetical protein
LAARVGHVDDRPGNKIDPVLRRDLLDLAPWADERWLDQARLGGLDGPTQRALVARVHHHARDRRDAAGALHQRLVDVVGLNAEGRPLDEGYRLPPRGCRHLGYTGEHLLPVLVGAAAVEADRLAVRLLRSDRDRRRDRVAQEDRGAEAKLLAEIDRTRPRQLVAQQARDQ